MKPDRIFLILWNLFFTAIITAAVSYSISGAGNQDKITWLFDGIFCTLGARNLIKATLATFGYYEVSSIIKFSEDKK